MSDEIPDVIGTTRAYRSWRLGENGVLMSWNFRHGWGKGINEAWCPSDATLTGIWAYGYPYRMLRLPQHIVPVQDCHCGFYACTDPHSGQIPRGACVYGVIEMSGGIVPHEKNSVHRCAKAEIVALCMSRWDFRSSAIRMVRAYYPGVKIYGSKEKMLKDFPPAGPGTRRRITRAGVISAVAFCAANTMWDTGVAISGHPFGIPLACLTSGAGLFCCGAGLFCWRKRKRAG